MVFLGLERSLLLSLPQLVQFLAQLGEQLLSWIGFLTCLLGGTEIGFHHSVVLVPVQQSLVVCVVCVTPYFLHSLQDLLK